MINIIQTVMLTGRTHTTLSAQDGVKGNVERLDINLSTAGAPKNEIVFKAIQAHPAAEQLFAGAWSACYTGALGLVAKAKKVPLPPDMSVAIEIDLGRTGAAYFIQARIDVCMPGISPDVVSAIAHEAHGVCPYSKAVNGNIDVTTNIVPARSADAEAT